MKLYAVLLLVAAVTLATCVAQSHHAGWGELRWNSTAIFVYQVKNDSKWQQTVQRTVQYPPPGVINNRPIHAIRAYDQNTNGNGANVTLIAYGVNYTRATLLFKSKIGQGIDFKLEIYA